MAADGSSQVKRTDNAFADSMPAWSPDGTQIAFYSDRDGNNEIYTMAANGSSQTNRTSNAADDREPAWSPDGAQIAFSTNRDGPTNFEIYTMGADGSTPVNRTNTAAPAGEFQPDWQPIPGAPPPPPDTTAPAVTLTSPADGSASHDPRPTFAGAAGTAAGDSQTVRVELARQQSSNSFTMVEGTSTRRSGGSWTVRLARDLPPGRYGARARQADAAGNDGASTVSLFTVQPEVALDTTEKLTLPSFLPQGGDLLAFTNYRRVKDLLERSRLSYKLELKGVGIDGVRRGTERRYTANKRERVLEQIGPYEVFWQTPPKGTVLRSDGDSLSRVVTIDFYDPRKDVRRPGVCPVRERLPITGPDGKRTHTTMAELLTGLPMDEAVALLKRYRCSRLAAIETREDRKATEARVTGVRPRFGLRGGKRQFYLEVQVRRPRRPSLGIVTRERSLAEVKGNPGQRRLFEEELTFAAHDRRLTLAPKNLTTFTVQVLELSTGRLLKGAQVELYDTEGRLRNSETSNSLGEATLTFAADRAGELEVVARVEGTNGQVMEGWKNERVFDRTGSAFTTVNGRRFKAVKGGRYVPVPTAGGAHTSAADHEVICGVLKRIVDALNAVADSIDFPPLRVALQTAAQALAGAGRCSRDGRDAVGDVANDLGVRVGSLAAGGGSSANPAPAPGGTTTAWVFVDGEWVLRAVPAIGVTFDAPVGVVSGSGYLAGLADGTMGLGGTGIYDVHGKPVVEIQGQKLVGKDGASLIGNDGSTLIGNDGSTLIGNDGSTLQVVPVGLLASNGSK
jgi:hypothetical protein